MVSLLAASSEVGNHKNSVGMYLNIIALFHLHFGKEMFLARPYKYSAMDAFGPAEYLCYRVLLGLERRKPRHTSRSRFHKISAFADHILEEDLEGDAVLPRYWFMFGETLDDHAINREIFNAPSASFWEGQEYLPARFIRPEEFQLPSESRRLIDKAVSTAVGRYWDDNAIELRREQYQKFAPNEFIATYSELRDILELVDLDSQTRLELFNKNLTNTDIISNYLDDMLASYPKEQYSDIYDEYLLWDDTMRIILEGEPNFAEFERLLNRFIRALSIVELRVHHHRNIPNDTLDSWQEDRYIENEDFRQEIKDIRDSALEGYDLQEILTDTIAESYNDTVLTMITDMDLALE